MEGALKARVQSVRERIGRACARSGRDPSAVTLLAVTKGVAPERIREAFALGLADFGENRVQEASIKQQELAAWLEARGSKLELSEPRTPSPQPVRWHLIGHLQRNKAKPAAELFHAVHSVDSPPLIEALDRAASGSRPLAVLVQVNVSGETTKYGCRPEDAMALAQAVKRATHLRLRGLMTMAPFSDDPEAARPHFRRLRELRQEVAAAIEAPVETLKLSMGMSQDFEVAIEEGADLVRVGTAIFGESKQAGRGAGDMGRG